MLAVRSSSSSAPEGAMLPIAPQDEPWDQEMEVFGDGASSGEVSVVTKRGCSHPPPSLWTLARARERRGVVLGSWVPKQSPWRLRGSGASAAPTALSSLRAGGDQRAGLYMGIVPASWATPE